MQDALNAIVGALHVVIQYIGLYIASFQAHDIWSILIGMFAATLFEIPIISRFKRH